MRRRMIEIVTPRFERPKGEPGPTWTPRTREDWDSLHGRTALDLQEIGLRRWGDVPEGSGRVLWLFPGEWYAHIPTGLAVVDIFGAAESFVAGVTDDDIRGGCLSFGILVPCVLREADVMTEGRVGCPICPICGRFKSPPADYSASGVCRAEDARREAEESVRYDCAASAAERAREATSECERLGLAALPGLRASGRDSARRDVGRHEEHDD